MEEKAGLDCQVLQDGEASRKVSTTQSKQSHEIMPCCPASCQDVSYSPEGFVGQSGEPRSNFEYIFPFIDDANWCIFLDKCEIGTVY